MRITQGLAPLVLFTVIVAALAWIGIELGVRHAPLAPFWPCNGFTLAALLLRPRREWPWILAATGAGIVVVDLALFGVVHPYPVVPIAEPWIAAVLIQRHAAPTPVPPTLSYWVRATLCGPVVAAGLGAAVGAAIMASTGTGYELPELFRAWWFADALGQAIVVPAVVTFFDPTRPSEQRRMWSTQRLEIIVFVVAFLVVTGMAVALPVGETTGIDVLHHAVAPMLIWAVLRFPGYVAFDALAYYACLAAWQLSLGRGPFFFDEHGRTAWAIAYQVPLLMLSTGVQMVYVLATERRIADETLAANERRLRDIIETTKEWIWEVDLEGRFTFASPHCRSILGYEPGEVLGTRMMDNVAEEDHSLVRDYYRSRIHAARPAEGVLHRRRRKDGATIWVETNVVPILDEAGRLVGCRGVDRDVTARIVAEADASKLREGFAQAEKLVALGTLVSGVAHEINNPNQVITLNVPILRQAWRDVVPAIEAYASVRPEWRIAGLPPRDAQVEGSDAIEEIAEGSDRIRMIVAALREYLRGEPERPRQTVDLDAILRRTIQVASQANPPFAQTLHLELAQDLPTIRADSPRLEQVLEYLLSNAGKAMRGRAGVVTIRSAASADRRWASVAVTDEGEGIAAAELSRVMDPYFSGVGVGHGKGLGLAISSRIAREHGGRLEVESEPGRGTTLRLTLPAAS